VFWDIILYRLVFGASISRQSKYSGDKGRKVPQIAGSLPPIYKTQHSKGSETLTAPPSECHISEQKYHMASDMTRNDQYTGVWKDIAMLYSQVISQYLTKEVTQLRSWSGILWLELSSISPAITC